MIKIIFKTIWNVSKFLKIPLGRFAPFVFEKMLGIKGVIKDD